MAPNTKSLTRKWLAGIIYGLLLVLSCAHAFHKPMYNWDMLAYMGVVAELDNKDATAVHDVVYNDVREHVPPAQYAALIDTTAEFKKKMFTDAMAYHQLLGIYTVNHLYLGMIWLSHKAGLSLSKATVVPSVISYFIIGMLLFLWCISYADAVVAAVCCGCMMFTAPMLLVAKLSTPDALSGLLLFAAMYYILERRRLLPAVILLLLSLFARIDNVILSFLLVTLIAWHKSWISVSRRQYIVIACALVACYLGISYSGTHYGWSILYYPSFTRYLDSREGLTGGFSFIGFGRMALTQLRSGFYFEQLIVYVMLLLLLFTGKRPQELRFDRAVALLFIAVILFRFILFPVFDDRFYIGMYVTTVMLLVRRLSGPGQEYISMPH